MSAKFEFKKYIYIIYHSLSIQLTRFTIYRKIKLPRDLKMLDFKEILKENFSYFCKNLANRAIFSFYAEVYILHTFWFINAKQIWMSYLFWHNHIPGKICRPQNLHNKSIISSKVNECNRMRQVSLHACHMDAFILLQIVVLAVVLVDLYRPAHTTAAICERVANLRKTCSLFGVIGFILSDYIALILPCISN